MMRFPFSPIVFTRDLEARSSRRAANPSRAAANPSRAAANPSRSAASLPACPRWRSAERWTRRRLGDVGHEQRVTHIATRLFDLTLPHHDLSRADLKLLQTAAVVHDVGRSVCDPTHHIDGARMLLNDSHLPLTTVERRQVAYLTRYHKGAVPRAGNDEILHEGDDHNRLLRLLALLRSADALDSRKVASPRLVLAMAGSDRTPRLAVTCYLETESAKARKVYTRRKKFKLLETMFGIRVDVRIAHSGALATVA